MRSARSPLARALAAAALFAVVAALAAAPAGGFSAGRSDRALAGCGDAGCHGVSGQSGTVEPVLAGLPEQYTPGETYLLNVSMSGAPDPLPPPAAQFAGGFALGASDGALSVPPGAGDVHVDDSTGNATHTAPGAKKRAWTVVWTAPPPTAGSVTFHLAVNAVNGNAVPDPLDQWSVAAFTTMEGPVPEGPPAPDVNSSSETAPAVSGGSRLPAPPAAATLAALAATALAFAALLRMPPRRRD